MLQNIIEQQNLFVHAIEFGEDSVAITYQEKRDINETAGMAKTLTMLIVNEEEEAVYQRIQQDIERLIDSGVPRTRNPEFYNEG